MCLILFTNNHPDYKLIIAANRDEFYNRHTREAGFWEDTPNLLAGKDMEAGGTWMGMSTNGRISMLTNYRDLTNIKSDAPSRGHLVSGFLIGEGSADDYLTEIEPNGHRYNGFNLLCGTVDDLWYYGNYQNGVHKVEKGVHGLSNALLNSEWPKVVKGTEKLEAAISNSLFNTEDLFEVLSDDRLAPDNDLPKTGVGLEKERLLSPVFIKMPGYGSRCSTVIMVNNKNEVTFAERTYNIDTQAASTVNFSFSIQN